MQSYVCTGNLVDDPEMRYTGNGTPVTKFRIGVRGGGRDKDDTLFIDVQCWDKLAESVADLMRKGSFVIVLGTLREDKWEDKESGQKRSKTLVNAQLVEFGPKGDRDRDDDRGRRRDRDDDDDRGRNRGRDDDRGRSRGRDDDRPRRDRDDDGDPGPSDRDPRGSSGRRDGNPF